MEHIIISKSYRYTPHPQNDVLKEYHFSSLRGLWINNTDETPLIRTENGPRPSSKKCDVETGEDRKGE